jgi:hypothetical protein
MKTQHCCGVILWPWKRTNFTSNVDTKRMCIMKSLSFRSNLLAATLLALLFTSVASALPRTYVFSRCCCCC